MKTAFLFSGQGAQYVGMGQDLLAYDCAKEIFERANKALGFSITDIMFSGPTETLMETKYTQPAILTQSIAIFEILKEKGYQPDVVAGLSLGEYGALYAAGVFDLETVIQLVHKRGMLMEEATTDVETAMYAVLGASREQIKEACEQAKGIVEIANYNCKGQIVIAGEKKAVQEAVAILKEQKVKAIPLKVSSAFHTSMLKPAGQKLAEILEDVPMQMPTCPVLANVTGTIYPEDAASIKELLAKQVSSSVYFEDELLKMAEMGVTEFIEIGPKNTLTTFVKKTLKEVTAVATDTQKQIEELKR